MNGIDELRKAILKLHGLEAVHIESVPVREEFRGTVIWDGVVEVFAVSGHPKTDRCFAWSHADGKADKDTRFVAVLAVPPVDTPRKAVKAAIVSQFRS